MKILVLNSGSSSIKFQLFSMKERKVLASGLIEQIGEPLGKIKLNSLHRKEPMVQKLIIPNHEHGIEIISSFLIDDKIIESLDKLDGIGHRVVHGGEFNEAQLINDDIMQEINKNISLAPIHNPANIAGIKAAEIEAPNIPQVAVFDTAFHQTMPPHAYTYALPYDLCQKLHIRRYGFHGTSHKYIAEEAAKILKKPLSKCNLITLHLGGGASVAAIKNGKCIDTSMGLSPLEGLIMGTRSGDLDPAIIFYLKRVENLKLHEIDTILNKQSGLKGICGTNDLREVQEKMKDGDERAKLAFDMFCYHIKKYIGSYYAVLGRVDAIIFTGGIGENSADVRYQSCEGLSHLGIILDKKRNSTNSTHIESKKSVVKALVIPTNEELEIAKLTQRIIQGQKIPQNSGCLNN
ncbi:MAG: acetate kinase [Campylobacteraceae bacterium]|jgi:acetate kinase|nr:acetate kinase [Campylobacteraceae bacterium]